MPVNATVNVTRVVIQKQGRKGLPGDDGTDGIGIQTVRMSKLNNPTLKLFNKNLIADTLFDAMAWIRSTNAFMQDRYGQLKEVVPNIPNR